MKKLISIGILLAMVISACTPALVKTVEVIWYVRSNELEQKWENETIIANFEKKFPKIQIKLTVVNENDFDTRMQAMIATGNPPDIWSHWGPSGFQDYVKRGLVADLTPFIQKDNFDLTDFEPSVLNTYKVDGKVMGLPMLTTGSFIFYNKDLFDKAGVAYPTVNWDDKTWTYDRFLELCKTLTRTSGDPRTDVYGCNLDLWPNDAFAWLFGDLYPDSAYSTGFAGRFYLNDPLVIQGFQARRIYVWKYRSTQSRSGRRPDRRERYFRGSESGYGVDRRLGLVRIRRYQGLQMGRCRSTLRLPHPQRRALYRSLAALLQKQSPPGAWTFLKYLTDAPQQETWMKLTGTPRLARAWPLSGIPNSPI